MTKKILEIVKAPADDANYDKRIRFIVLHYTDVPEETALWILQHSGVSTHYLVPQNIKELDQKEKLVVKEIVSPLDRAWHAGLGEWQKRKNLNDTSIGIEIINAGYGLVQEDGTVVFYYQINEKIKQKLTEQLQTEHPSLLEALKKTDLLEYFFCEILYGRIPPLRKEEYKKIVPLDITTHYRDIVSTWRKTLDPFIPITNDQLYFLEKTGKLVWQEFTDYQVEVLILLIKKLIDENTIKLNDKILYCLSPTAIIGHADLAPGRKVDPGPKFPWQKLAQAGIGAWPDPQDIEKFKNHYQNIKVQQEDNIGWLQENLATLGYAIKKTNILDAQTKEVLIAFQMHFRPQKYDGGPDTETYAIVAALIKKYFLT